MTGPAAISTIGVHESVDRVFPAENLVDYLRGLPVDVELVDTTGVERCDALVTIAYEDAFLDADLDWIHTIQAGYDRFPVTDLEAHGVALTNSSGIHSESVGETVLGYLLMFARQLHRYRWSQRDHEWDRPDWHEPFTLADQTLCVVGLGTLGQGIAKRASCLGMTVVGVKRTVTDVPNVDIVYSDADLPSALDSADAVVLAVPLNEETRGLIGPEELELLSDAYLVNVSRGEVVDQNALVDALSDGTLAGAALDVFETEPLPEDSPLWDMQNVIVSPHVAAHTRDYYKLTGDIVRENVTRIVASESLKNRVV